MKKSLLRIATRQSPMALAQTEQIKAQLLHHHPELNIELMPMKTKGDKLVDVPLAKIGGKGVFTKELEVALYDNRADIAVHSVKDMAVKLPTGLIMPVIFQRDNPFDALVSPHYQQLTDLPDKAIIGTSSLRRQCQLRMINPSWQLRGLRGNVISRLQKLDQGQFDAIILGAAGLKRVQLDDRIQQYLTADMMLPAIGQGTIGIECRADDIDTQTLIKPLNHATSFACVSAERMVNKVLEGGCQVPIAAFAQVINQQLELNALVSSLDAKQVLQVKVAGKISDAEVLGQDAGQQLLALGAANILEEIYRQHES